MQSSLSYWLPPTQIGLADKSQTLGNKAEAPDRNSVTKNIPLLCNAADMSSEIFRGTNYTLLT